MKIVKIELQNINSLKCNTPIVIDFESEVFRNIGLFAITGSTGAGKTTILDAITIALYNSVPRFNKSNIKAGLEDVVSYGADEAMARVTFDTKGSRYESQWGIRLVAKTGKRLSSPIEKVRLKNLSSGKIIAEQKRELKAEIENITQLSYEQFLRSVMLAQGEFAAFLSANAKDKGNLLEQITGEEIYKKIGESISDRIYVERKTLEKIRSKINTEDLLSDEISKELRLEELSLSKNIKDLDAEFKEIERICNWFKKDVELINTRLKLENGTVALVQEKEISQMMLTALELHEKAEPFKAEVDELNRIEKELQQRTTRSEALSLELSGIMVKLEEVLKQKTVNEKELTENEKEFKKWLPKLEEVTKLDADLLNTKKTMETNNQSIETLATTLKRFKEEHEQKTKQYETNGISFKKGELFLHEHKNVSEIEKKFNAWNSKLTLRESNRERISVFTENIKTSEKELVLTRLETEKATLLFEAENKKTDLLKVEVDRLTKLLSANKPEQFLLSQKKLEIRKELLKELQSLAVNHSELNVSAGNLKLEKEKLELSNKEAKEANSLLQSSIENAQKALKDAETILELKRTIKSFEEERKKLEVNKACPLCGSTEHPYVEKYDSIELSKSQTELAYRKEQLDTLVKKEKVLALKLVEIKTKLENNASQSKTIQQQLDITRNKFVSYETEFNIESAKNIKAALLTLQKEIDLLSFKIVEAQKLQNVKDEQEKGLTIQREKISEIKVEMVKLNEKSEGIVKILAQTKAELKTLSFDTGEMESTLMKELSVFDLELPETKETNEFVKRLETGIAQYQHAKERLVTLKNTLAQLTADLKYIEQQQKEKGDEKAKLGELFKKSNETLGQVLAKRSSILPLETSTENKRDTLQKALAKAKAEFDKINIEFNRLTTLQATHIKEVENLNKEQSAEQISFANKTKVLNARIEPGIFGSKQEVETALLSFEKKTKYIAIRKQLEEKALSLKTLEAKLAEDYSKQEKEKNFELGNEQALEKQTELESLRKQLHERAGEIKKQFELDQQIKNRNKGVMAEISAQEKVVKKWSDLLNILGGSKHAFNTYVQRLTLQNLINLANVHLFKLNKRYSLQMSKNYKPGEELNFKLIDHYQTNEARLVDTSSGGEKFLISLSLALGLSDLASNNVSIGSLFIDEGFGSLDNNTLATVITSLETLHAQGKMIGIISHVENFKERIPTQIQVIKKSNGVSEVEIV